MLGIGLWVFLVWYAGVWNILANTRVLSLLIDGGVIAYTDAQMGWIHGLPSHEYYLATKDPVKWPVVWIVVGLFGLFWLVKAWQFHGLARYHGIPGTLGEHSRIYLFGLGYKKLFPFHIGETALVAALQKRGATLEQGYSLTFLATRFVWLEIAVFSLYGLYAMGWANWFLQALLGLVIVGTAWWWLRRESTAPHTSGWAALRGHWAGLSQRPGQLVSLSLLSLFAFGLEDIAAYLLAMGFTSEHVILNVDFSLLLMGVVGSYIARLICVTPGGLGQFEWGFAMALYLGGLGFPEAATIAILDNFFRYSTFAVIWIATTLWHGTPATLNRILALAAQPWPKAADWRVPAPTAQSLQEIPAVPVPQLPGVLTFWRRAQAVAWVVLGVFLLDRLSLLLGNFWLLQSLGYESVFWTNFRMGATLFVVTFAAWFGGIALAGWTHRLSARGRGFVLHLGAQVGLLCGYVLSLHYLDFLLFTGETFNQADPVFGHDLSFYFFTLPTIKTVWGAVTWWLAGLVGVGLACAYAATRQQPAQPAGTVVANRLWHGVALISTPFTRWALLGLGLALTVGLWLARYGLLYKNNEESSIRVGAEYIDVTGLFSTLNYYYVSAAAVLVITLTLVLVLGGWHRIWRQGHAPAAPPRLALALILAVVVADVTFAGVLYLRDLWLVRPNEPILQLPYLQTHIDATRTAYNFDAVAEIEFMPNTAGDPLPDVETLLASPTLQNVPLWPTYASYLEPVLDPAYTGRIFQTKGDTLIYGPTLESFRQNQQLRTYYDFLSVDPLRFEIDGEKRMFASAVREIPLMEPYPWLAWWGQRFVLFTHGYGLVMAPVNEFTTTGEPKLVSQAIPVETAYGELKPGNDRVYYGEGASSVAFSNIQHLPEFDYPTAQGRAESTIPAEANIGSAMDSPWKRLVFGWRSGRFWEMLFSELITPETRIHFLRTPLERLSAVAPFLWWDNNAYAVPTEEAIVWLVNGLAHSNYYPYSYYRELGDKSVSRWFKPTGWVWANYIEDAVKATVNAYTGEVKLYQIADEPLINTFAQLYPALFVADATMPEEVRQQLTYSMHLFHWQFDDSYIYYHMQDAVYFFNMEDMWDDGDEVLGPILDQGSAINFSIEPYHLLLETGGVLPAAAEKTQFTLMAVFTPENALNLRALPLVYQDGADYGKLAVLQIPKGQFVLGPAQADATIDQDPEISQLITWLNRRGAEVIRGHTTTLIVENEVIYVEPLFIRSQQNPVPQLHRVTVIFRGHPYMAETLEEALRMAVAGQSTNAEVAVVTP
jgi:hypothetical protein